MFMYIFIYIQRLQLQLVVSCFLQTARKTVGVWSEGFIVYVCLVYKPLAWAYTLHISIYSYGKSSDLAYSQIQ